jgi:hypothetical protein
MLRLVLRGEALGEPHGCNYENPQAKDPDGFTDPMDRSGSGLPIIHIKIPHP